MYTEKFCWFSLQFENWLNFARVDLGMKWTSFLSHRQSYDVTAPIGGLGAHVSGWGWNSLQVSCWEKCACGLVFIFRRIWPTQCCDQMLIQKSRSNWKLQWWLRGNQSSCSHHRMFQGHRIGSFCDSVRIYIIIIICSSCLWGHLLSHPHSSSPIPRL